MPSTTSDPYISATLSSTDATLDLSGKQPFTLSITLTLHASAPILAYTEQDDTFFLPRNALTISGIVFRNHHTKDEIRTCHIDSRKREGYARALTSTSKLLLYPERPVVFAVPFDIRSDSEDKAGGFDSWLATITGGFEDGGVYDATLPLYRTLDWWRYAKYSEIHHDDPATTTIAAAIGSVVDSVVKRWTGDEENRYGVPVLAEDKQLPIYVEGDGVVFRCVGEKMQWPADMEEKQRVNRDRREGQERAKAEAKRIAREGKE